MARKSIIKVALKDAMTFCKEKKGYVAAFAVLGIIGLTSVFVFSANQQKPAEQQNDISVYATPSAKERTEQVSKSNDEKLSEILPDISPMQTVIPDFTMPPEAEHSGQKNSGTSNEKLIAPVDGEIIWGYAVDELIFSRTLSQWMTHSGVDIASPKGTEVYALKGGCIENVYTDDLLGVTVVVAHDDGMMSVYANLKEEPPVSEGQLIESRDLIGFIGDTAISECGDASHLHFELYKGTNTVNPVDYVRFDKTSIE